MVRSSDKTESVRVTETEQAAARQALERAGWSVGDFLRAALVAVAAKPTEVLATLKPYRRPQKAVGRPPKSPRAH